MSIVKNWGVILVIAAAMTGCGQECIVCRTLYQELDRGCAAV